MVLGIALAGGGARGAAHLGILQALEDNGIKADCYAGTSAGSIVAAAKAFGFSNKLSHQLLGEINSSLIDVNYWGLLRAIPNKFSHLESLLKGKQLKKLLDSYFNVAINSVRYPLAIVSSDANTGAEVIFSSKDLNMHYPEHNLYNYTDIQASEALRASSSIPGVYPPTPYKEHKLLDGSLVNNLPADIARALGADKVIAIDLALRGTRGDSEGLFSLLAQSLDIMVEQGCNYALEKSGNHLYLNPMVVDVTIFDFNRAPELYYRGYKYGQSMIQTIEDFLGI